MKTKIVIALFCIAAILAWTGDGRCPNGTTNPEGATAEVAKRCGI